MKPNHANRPVPHPESRQSRRSRQSQQSRRKRTALWPLALTALVLTAAVLWICADHLFTVSACLRRGTVVETVTVPDLVGTRFSDSGPLRTADGQILDRGRFPLTVLYTHDPDGTAPPRTILDQQPPAGARRKIDTARGSADCPLRITVSLGVHEWPVPDLAGLDEREATVRLERQGFHVERDIAGAGDAVSIRNEVNESGSWTVLSTTPAAGQPAREGATVILHLTAGDPPGPGSVICPSLVGLPFTEAVRALHESGLKLGRISLCEDDPTDNRGVGATAEPDFRPDDDPSAIPSRGPYVWVQSHRAGTYIPAGSMIDISINHRYSANPG